jgi:hypothetical protein
MARHDALLKGTDIPRAVSIFIEMMEVNLCVNQAHAAQHNRWAIGDILPLSPGYWEEQHNRAALLSYLVAAGVLTTGLYPDRPLPVHEWRDDVQGHALAGPDIDRFFALLTGTDTQTDGDLEAAVLALRRLRTETLPLQHLCLCHLRLLYTLYSSSEEWKPVGDALAKIVTAQWRKASETQRFALTHPALYAPMLKAQCEDTRRGGFAQVAAILTIATAATGVRLSQGAAAFLAQVESGRGSIS